MDETDLDAQLLWADRQVKRLKTEMREHIKRELFRTMAVFWLNLVAFVIWAGLLFVAIGHGLVGTGVVSGIGIAFSIAMVLVFRSYGIKLLGFLDEVNK